LRDAWGTRGTLNDRNFLDSRNSSHQDIVYQEF
jgi:hypothetical protein